CNVGCPERPIPGPGDIPMFETIRRHPLASYFLLAISISWIGIFVVVLPGSIPASPADAERLFVPVHLAMLLGPSGAAVAVTAITGGLREYRDRWARSRWRCTWSSHCSRSCRRI